MKVIILAAGSGSRLGSITENIPKPLVEINGRSIIERQIDIFQNNGISDIVIITGAKKEKFNIKNISYVYDSEYYKHDQLGSLIAAYLELSGELLITFGDILFDEHILEQILSNSSNFAIAVDLNWTKSYEKRIDNPIELAGKVLIKDEKIREFSENLPIEKEGCLIGEFLGIIKIGKLYAPILQKYLLQLKKNHKGKFHDAESFECAKITDFLQELLESNIDITPIFINGKWCEIDTLQDLEIAKEQFL